MDAVIGQHSVALLADMSRPYYRALLAYFPDLPVRSQRQPDHGMRGAQAGTSRQPLLWPAACHR